MSLTQEQSDEVKRLEAIGYKYLGLDEPFECRKCWKAGGLLVKGYDNDVYDDKSYRCALCRKGWISEGADY